MLDQNKDSIFVLESDPSNSDIFTEKNSPPTFMSQALEFAKKNNIQVEIMDDERISKDRYGIWQEAGTDFSQQDFDIINAIYIMRMGLNAVSYTHLRAHETVLDIVCRLLLEKKNK